MAEYLEQIQWKVRPATLVPETEPALRQTLQVCMTAFTEVELRKAIQKARSGTSCKEDDVPVQFCKALAQEPGDALQPFLQ